MAHSIYGVANTINCANYVYFLALEKCHSLNCAPVSIFCIHKSLALTDTWQAMNVFVQELLNLHRGQGQDILWREQCSCPTGESQIVHDTLVGGKLIVKTIFSIQRGGVQTNGARQDGWVVSSRSGSHASFQSHSQNELWPSPEFVELVFSNSRRFFERVEVPSVSIMTNRCPRNHLFVRFVRATQCGVHANQELL